MHVASVAAARVADSDREAGHWVMEFAPAESASQWQMLVPSDTGGKEVLIHSHCHHMGGPGVRPHTHRDSDRLHRTHGHTGAEGA